MHSGLLAHATFLSCYAVKGKMQQGFKSQRTVGSTTFLRHTHGTLLRQRAPHCKQTELYCQRQRGRKTGTKVYCQATHQSTPGFLTDQYLSDIHSKSHAELAPHIGPIKVAKLPGIGRSFSPHNCHVIRWQKGCGDDKRCEGRGAAGCLHPSGVFLL